jgi:hypothetical protein
MTLLRNPFDPAWGILLTLIQIFWGILLAPDTNTNSKNISKNNPAGESMKLLWLFSGKDILSTGSVTFL